MSPRLPILPAADPRTVVLVDLPWTRDKDPRVPLGHASILASLRAAGVEVHPVVAPVNAPGFSAEALADAVLAACAGVPEGELLVGVGAYAWNEPFIAPLLAVVSAARPDALLVVGGPQVSFADAPACRHYPIADAVVRGAGEPAMVRLARAERGERIAGVAWAGAPDEETVSTVSLDALPSPFLTGVVPVEPGGFLRWETKRGCLFRCSFCQHRDPRPGAVGSFPLRRIEQELRLFARIGVADIAVLDPIFTDGERSREILRLARRVGLRARISLQVRPELVDEAFLAAAEGLDLRLEFGLQTIHAAEGRAVRRVNHVPKVAEAIERVRAAGIPFEVSLIYGLPEQTRASFQESVRWCLERGVPVLKAFPLVLLRGTKLERERSRWGLVEDDGVISQVVGSHSFDVEDHREMAALSEALSRTEGAHPPLAELLRLAASLEADPSRFTPERAAEAS